MLSGAPAPGGQCRVCGGKLSDSLRCGQCGAAYGESNRCPHCRSVADTEPHDALRHRCRVCGGPRVAVEDAEIVRSGREIPVLRQARRADTQRAAWKVGAGVVAGFGALSLLVAVLVIALVTPRLVGSLAALAAVAVPFVVRDAGWVRAKALASERDAAVEKAWTLVASDVLAYRGAELTAPSPWRRPCGSKWPTPSTS